MNPVSRPGRVKYTTEELMELIDIFNVSPEGQTAIKSILAKEEKAPDAGNFFRYYNDRSKVPVFEKMFGEAMDSKYVLGVNSGTSALIAALAAVGVGPGDEVILPAYTFFASVSAVVVAKAIPIIVDINESLTIDPAEIEKHITPRTKAILPVHMVGLPCEMDKICAIAKKHNLSVIEDTAQATGGTFKGKKLGTWGTMGCFSLDAYKVIGSGEGGAICTDDEWFYTRAQSYHDTAACWRPDRYARERKEGELFCGENYRMSETSAAVGIAQVRKLEGIVEGTRRIYNQLRNEIKLPSCARWVEPCDVNGVCGYQLGMLFENQELAIKAIEGKIGLGGLAARDTQGVRDWHVAWNWEHILEQKTLTTEGCPFKCPLASEVPKYNVDSWPKTRNIMRRLAVIGINPTDTPEWAAWYAKDMSEKLAKVF